MEKNNLRDALEFLGIRGIRVKTLLTPPKVHNYVLRRSPFQWKDSRSKTLVDLQDVGCLMSYWVFCFTVEQSKCPCWIQSCLVTGKLKQTHEQNLTNLFGVWG